VAERKQILEALRAWTAPPVLGVPPEVVTDPFVIMNYGIDTDRVRRWLAQPAESAKVVDGHGASAGVVEGRARVISSEKELDQIQDGEVLVCPTTAPSWAPIFSRISAVVSDIGGMMCHAAIVCREYGLPAVVGTGAGTTMLRTGQQVRVDGGAGTVTVLEEAAGATAETS
jgi:pyruvate,water dikinase